MLRDHEVFQKPLPVNLRDAVTVEVPDAWKGQLKDAEIRVLPLVEDRSRSYPNGWCTYTYEHVQAAELEIICGGINSKTPKASAIWRQGHLLHFGFEQSPADFNDNGRALLVNSICYIARFREDRPIVRPPSDVRRLDRGAIQRLVEREDRELAPYLDWFFAGELRKALHGKTRAELAKWYGATRGFLRADARAKFVVDEEAREFGVAPDSPEFVAAAIASWNKSTADGPIGRRLLLRYVPSGPGADAPAQAWQAWWDKNRRYLFFSDTGGFCWLIDPLARRRGVPTRALRGPARATAP